MAEAAAEDLGSVVCCSADRCCCSLVTHIPLCHRGKCVCVCGQHVSIIVTPVVHNVDI